VVQECSLGLSAATPQEQCGNKIDPGGVADSQFNTSATPPGSVPKPMFSWGVAALNPRLKSAIPSGSKSKTYSAKRDFQKLKLVALDLRPPLVIPRCFFKMLRVQNPRTHDRFCIQQTNNEMQQICTVAVVFQIGFAWNWRTRRVRMKDRNFAQATGTHCFVSVQ